MPPSGTPLSGTSFDPDSAPAWDANAAAPASAAGGPEPQIRPVAAPTALLFGAMTCVAIGALLVILATGVPGAMLAAWAAAGPVAIVLVGFFLGADAERRSHPYYLQQAWTRSAPLVIVAIGFVVVIASSWFFADWAARQ